MKPDRRLFSVSGYADVDGYPCWVETVASYDGVCEIIRQWTKGRRWEIYSMTRMPVESIESRIYGRNGGE